MPKREKRKEKKNEEDLNGKLEIIIIIILNLLNVSIFKQVIPIMSIQ